MTIGEIAKRSGVSRDTIRFYTQQNLIHCEYRRAGSRFYAEYDEDTVTQTVCIKKVQSLGFTLNELRPLISASAQKLNSDQIAILSNKLREIEEKRVQLIDLASFIRQRISAQ